MTLPNIVNTFIGLFKDTTLVFVVGIFDFLRTIEAARADPKWAAPTIGRHRLRLRRAVLFRLLLWHVALRARASKRGWRAPAGAKGAMDRARRQVRRTRRCPKWRSRSPACTNGTATFTSCATSI